MSRCRGSGSQNRAAGRKWCWPEGSSAKPARVEIGEGPHDRGPRATDRVCASSAARPSARPADLDAALPPDPERAAEADSPPEAWRTVASRSSGVRFSRHQKGLISSTTEPPLAHPATLAASSSGGDPPRGSRTLPHHPGSPKQTPSLHSKPPHPSATSSPLEE